MQPPGAPSMDFGFDSKPTEGGIVSQRHRSVLIGIFGTGMVTIATLTGCSPLPGKTLDPMYVKIGTKPASEPTPSASPQAKASPLAAPTPTGASVWVGRYRDSRGEGDVTFSLVRSESSLSGTWKLRTGGGGALTGVVGAIGRRWQVRMENTAAECPGTFEGWAEFGGTTLVGAYHGRDCEGPVSDGWLDLRPR